MIQFIADDVVLPVLDRKRIEQWIHMVAAEYGRSVGDMTYIFCSDKRILEVNRQFLSHDYYTDVITFDYSTPSRISGDIYISLDTVRSNSEAFVKKLSPAEAFDQELLRILIHGVLHLTGQGDKTPETKAQMTAKEEHALSLWSKLKG